MLYRAHAASDTHVASLCRRPDGPVGGGHAEWWEIPQWIEWPKYIERQETSW